MAASVVVDSIIKGIRRPPKQTKRGEFKKVFKKVPNPKHNKWSWFTGVGTQQYTRRKNPKPNRWNEDYAHGRW